MDYLQNQKFARILLNNSIVLEIEYLQASALYGTNPTSSPVVFDGPDSVGKTVVDDPSGVEGLVPAVK